MGSPLVCQPCLLEDHKGHPYHRVEVWDAQSDHFRKSSLHQAGLIVHFGHDGAPCKGFVGAGPVGSLGKHDITERLYGKLPDLHQPVLDRLFFSSGQPTPTMNAPEVARENPLDGEHSAEVEEEECGDSWEDSDPRWGSGTERLLLIGHSNGFHVHTVRFCRCVGHSVDWQQMLASRIWPATFERPRTGFTLECLRDFRYTSAVSKASPHAYHSKLQKQTGQGVVVQCPVSMVVNLPIPPLWPLFLRCLGAVS